MSIRLLPAYLGHGFLALLLLGGTALAQSSGSEDSSAEKSEEKADDKDKADEKKPPKIRALKDWAKDKERTEGFFAFYRDPINGDTFMEIRPDQVGQDFIYFTYTLEGSALDGLRRLGSVGDNYVLKLRRRFNRIDFVRQDTQYSYDEGSTLQGQNANVLSPMLASATVVARDPKDERVVIKVNDLFQGRDLLRMGELSPLGKIFGAEAGAWSKEKSNIRSIRNYADNSEIVSEYVFDYPKTSSAMSGVVAIQHSFVRMPKAGFSPRVEDPRVGFFTSRNTNLSTLDGTPWRDMIYRWRLEKKDPKAPLSEPVKPITYWIEKTTPLEYRDIIREAALRWNPVFEKMGFRNAIRVEVQPNDASWDAGDVNRNMIRWVASPVPQYAGYGPTIINPRTGEIVAADIMLEHATVQRWLRQDRMFSDATAAAEAVAAAGAEGEDHGLESCNAADGLKHSIAMAAMAVASRPGLSDEAREAARKAIVREGLYYLVLHEIGHTLGLTHNMMGSYFKPIDKLGEEDGPFGAALTNSVMDYPQVNLAPEGETQRAYFPTRPAQYDYWALAFAYDPALADEARRAAHLSLSTRPEHAFGNDGDAMGTTGIGMDPRVIPYDLSSQPVDFATRQLDMIRKAMGELVARNSTAGRSRDELRRTYDLLNSMYRQNVTVVTRYVGGVYTDRAFVGQETPAAAPFVPVDVATQKRAMALLGDYLFAPGALKLPDNLGAYLQFQRRGFDFFGRPQDAPLHADALGLQSVALGHLLHPTVLQRMTDASLYGNRYSADAMLRDLTAMIFDADIGGSVNSYRQSLQATYVTRAIAAMNGGRDMASKAALYGQVTAIDKAMQRAARKGDERTRTHRRYIRQLIRVALEK
jgi:hypothetical protein